VAIVVMATVSIWGLAHTQNSPTLNNAAFALFHITVLLTGCWAALRKPRPVPAGGPAVGTASAVDMRSP
jgi:hypothetical protein